jgi:hypothetical protein
MMADGIQFVMIKAWEGDSPDPNYKENAANCDREGLPYLAYVWLHESDGDERRDKCFDFIENAVIMLDWEQDGVSNVTVENWIKQYEARYDRQGAVYYGLYPPDNPTPLIGTWPRVFPEYTSPSGLKLQPWNGDPNPDWRNCWAIWQSSENGTVDGIEGDSDLDQLAPSITIEDFMNWLDNGDPLPPRPDVVKPAIRLLQLALNSMGYNAGVTDGIWGRHTQDAVDEYSGYNPNE